MIELAQLLELLGHTDTSLAALCWKPIDAGAFSTEVRTVAQLAELLADLPPADVWFSVNEMSGPPRTGARGGADRVARHAALWADLDVKDGAFASLDDAYAAINDLAEIVGEPPTAVISSGHGLQPLWAITDDESVLDTADHRTQATVVLARWRRLVDTVAAQHGAAADAVFDLPRILRAPGTINWKGQPVPATCQRWSGEGVFYAQIIDALDAYGVPELDSDRDQLLDEPVDTSTWQWAGAQTCAYATQMIDAWRGDRPDARHPWLLSQATRLAAAHRNGCLTGADHHRAIDVLTGAMESLCASGSNARRVAPSEVRAALDWGQQRASLMTDAQLARELGDHPHGLRLHVIDAGEDNIGRLASLRPSTSGDDGMARHLHADTDSDAEHAQVIRMPIRATLTDTGNAQRLVHAYGDRLRWVPSRAQWLAWDGTRWAPAEDAKPAMAAAREVAEALPEGTRDETVHKKHSLGRSGLSNMIELAKFDDAISVRADGLDSHPHLLNTPAGTVDLRTGQLHAHDPAQGHTKTTGVGIDPAQPTPRWSNFLVDTFGGDLDMIGYIQRLLGYAAIGQVTHHILPFFHGPGGNGKSQLTEVAMALLGDYATIMPTDALMSARYAHDTQLTRLIGTRLAVCSEVPEDGAFDEQRVKMLTGGDRIGARYLYANPIEFTPSHTLILSGNHQPAVKSGGNSLWRRLRLIPFNYTVPDNKKIDGLADILVAEEGPGILSWIVDGARASYHGLREPASVREATAAYEAEEDAFGRFLTDCLHLAPTARDHVKAEAGKVRHVYTRWCHDNGLDTLSTTAFGRELKRRTGTTVSRSGSKRFYRGVGLIDSDIDDQEGDR